MAARRGRGPEYTVEPGRQIYLDGRPFVSISREGDTIPAAADEVTHVLAAALNRMRWESRYGSPWIHGSPSHRHSAQMSEHRGVVQRYKVGARVVMNVDAVENYGAEWRGVVLAVTHVSTSHADHPGFDPGGGSALYDFQVESTGQPLPMSLYDWELEPARPARPVRPERGRRRR